MEWEDTLDVIEPDKLQRYLQTHVTVDVCQEDVLVFCIIKVLKNPDPHASGQLAQYK